MHKIISSLDITHSNILRDVHTPELADVHQCSKVDFPCCCAFFINSFHSLSTVAFASGMNIAWGERSSCTYSRFPEASVSERQISRIVRTILDSRFVCAYTRYSLRRTISEVCTSFFPGPHTRVPRTLRVLWSLEEFFPQTRRVARRDNKRLHHLKNKKIRWGTFIRSFHRNGFAYQSCNIIQNSVLFLQYQCIWISPDTLALVVLEQLFPVCMFGNTVFCME